MKPSRKKAASDGGAVRVNRHGEFMLERSMANTVRSQTVAHILVVDDDQAIRESLHLLLEAEGYQVAEAANGVAALDILHTSITPLVVLLDLRMPRLDGEGVLRAVAHDSYLAGHNAYVLLTANFLAVSPALAMILSELRAPVVPKPFDMDALLDIVHQLACRLVPPDDSLASSLSPTR
ncbi:MAG TPA: response regulator [Ktedonobacterales bacterium]|nr:response regulator [Ktedonobacterales bacterium]